MAEKLEQTNRTEVRNLSLGGRQEEILRSGVQVQQWWDFTGTANPLDKMCARTGALQPQATGRAIWGQQGVRVLQEGSSKYSHEKLWVPEGKRVGELESCLNLSKILLTHLVIQYV